MTNDLMRKQSGNVSDDRPIVTLLYKIMRDHLPVTPLEVIVSEIEDAKDNGDTGNALYCNGWLASYAKQLADRIENASPARTDYPPRYTMDEAQRQTVLLALALLLIQRPGWELHCRELAALFYGSEMFESFLESNRDLAREFGAGL